MTEKSYLFITVHRHPLSRFLTTPQISHKTIKNIRRKRDLQQYRRTFYFPFRTFPGQMGKQANPKSPRPAPEGCMLSPRKSIAKATVNPDEQNYSKTAYNLSLSSTLHEAILSMRNRPDCPGAAAAENESMHPLPLKQESPALEARITGGRNNNHQQSKLYHTTAEACTKPRSLPVRNRPALPLRPKYHTPFPRHLYRACSTPVPNVFRTCIEHAPCLYRTRSIQVSRKRHSVRHFHLIIYRKLRTS